MSTSWKILFAILLFFIALGTCGTAFETWVMNATTSTVMFPDGQHSWWDPRSATPPQEQDDGPPVPQEDNNNHQKGNI